MKKKVIILFIFIAFLAGFYIAFLGNWFLGENLPEKANKYFALSVLPFIIGGLLLFVYSRQKRY